MPSISLLAVAAAVTAGAVDLKFPSTPLAVEDVCEARAFMPAMDRVLHWCDDALTITDLASGKELKRFQFPRSYFRAHVLVSPDGSRLAVAATPKDDQRVWDLYVLDAESGAVSSKEEKFAKVEAGHREGLEKLQKKVRKSASELKEAASFAIFADSHDPDTFNKPFDAPNGLSIRWTAESGCDVTASRDGQVLRSSRLEKVRQEPNKVKTEDDYIAMVEAEQARHKHERARNACDGLIASQDGRRLVFGQLAYATEVDARTLQHVADTQRAEDYVTQGLGAMKFPPRPAIALKDFERAVSLNPRLGEAHMYLGLTHLKLEHAREAAAALKEASSLMDKGYGKDLAEVQARAEALARVQDTLKNDPNDTAALRHRMLFRISNDDFAGCSADYTAAKKLKAKLTPIEEETGKNCLTEATRQAEAEMRARQEAADAGARESLRKASEYRSSSWWSSVDLAGMSRAINAGTNAVGNSGSGGSSASTGYRPSGSGSAYSSGSSGAASGPSSAARDQALVNQRVEKKLWDMNNPNNRR